MDSDFPSYYITINVFAQAAVFLTLAVGLALAVRRAGLSDGAQSAMWAVIMGALAAWFAVALWLGEAGIFLARTSIVPPIAFPIVLPIAAALVILAVSPRFKALIEAVPQSWLTGVQVYRALGAMFLVLWLQGLMPGEFAIPAGSGDVIVGLTAPIIAWLNATGSSSARPATIVWNLFGIADLVIAIGTGFLTSPSPYQMLAFDRPNTLIVQDPFVMVPAFLVPLSIILHLMSLWKLRRSPSVQTAFA
jgi:hypothetical protein